MRHEIGEFPQYHPDGFNMRGKRKGSAPRVYGPAIPMLIMFAVSAVATYVQTSAAQDAAAKQQQATANGLQANYAAAQLQQQQIAQQTSQKQSQAAQAAMLAKARFDAVSAESGVAGGSAARSDQVSDLALSQNESIIALNGQNSINQVQAQEVAAQSGATSSMIKVQAATPTWIGAGLQIAGGAAKAYAGVPDTGGGNYGGPVQPGSGFDMEG